MSLEALFQKSVFLTLGIMMVAAIVFYGVEKIRPVQVGRLGLSRSRQHDLAYAILELCHRGAIGSGGAVFIHRILS